MNKDEWIGNKIRQEMENYIDETIEELEGVRKMLTDPSRSEESRMDIIRDVCDILLKKWIRELMFLREQNGMDKR